MVQDFYFYVLFPSLPLSPIDCHPTDHSTHRPESEFLLIPVAIFVLCLHKFVGYYFIFVHSTHENKGGLDLGGMPLFLNF